MGSMEPVKFEQADLRTHSYWEKVIILSSFGFLLPLWTTFLCFIQKRIYKILSLHSSNIKKHKMWYTWYSLEDLFHTWGQNFVRKCQNIGYKKPNDNKWMEFWRRIPDHCIYVCFVLSKKQTKSHDNILRSTRLFAIRNYPAQPGK